MPAKTPVFNHDEDYARRRSTTCVEYTQKGARFDASFEFIDRIPGYKPPKAKKAVIATPAQPKRRGVPQAMSPVSSDDSPVMQSAKQKLDAFSDESVPSEIKKARKENAAAAAAEKLAE